MELTYIEVKKIINAVVTRVVSEIHDRYEKQSINGFLEKYKCKDEREFIEKMICKLSVSPDLSLNMREIIKNLEEESFAMSFDNGLKISQLKDANHTIRKLIHEIKSLEKLVKAYNEKTQYIEEYFENIQLVLRHNNLDYNDELKKVKPNSALDKPFNKPRR